MTTPVSHIVKLNDEIILSLIDVEWYDTATPYRYCAARLQELYVLAETTTFEIISWEKCYTIASQADFYDWIVTIFQHGKPYGFGAMFQRP